MKKTAVEWLYETLWKQTDFSLPNNILEQAKEMEKKQIIDAHIDGFYSPPFGKSRNGEANDYYDKTFKSE